jgi:hypothetical protein
VLRGVVATVIPACAVVAGSLEACSSGSSEGYGALGDSGKDAPPEAHVIVLAQVGFDAAADAPEVIVLAQVGFDAAADAPDGGG